ncbi:transglycosylase domain-containing protein [Methylobacterium sp. JK268]
MLAEPQTTPERDWLDLGTATGPAAAPPGRPAPLPAPRARLAAAARWQAALAARAVPLRRAVGRVTGEIAAHPAARAAHGRWILARTRGHAVLSRAAGLDWRRAAWAAALGPLALLGALLAVAAATLPPLSGPAPGAAPITVRAEGGEPVATRGAVRGKALAATEIAPAMRDAIVAAQDPWFADRYRLDAAGVASVIRSAFRSTIGTGPREGAPRLTQRLVRDQILGGAQGLVARVQEAMLVLWLQARETPEAIVARYLSGAPFGPEITGLDAAARRVFDKGPADLSTAEAAFLAGLTQRPTDRVADRDSEASRARARGVLDAMVMIGALRREAADQAAGALAGLRLPSATMVTRSGLPDLAVLAARDRLGDGFREAALRTSLDRSLQGAAEAAIAKRLDAAAQRRGDRVGLVALGPDGAVLAAASTSGPLAADPTGRAAAEASLRRVTRDGRPVYDRLQAATLDPAAVRARAFALLSGLARLPDGAELTPAARDGVTVGLAGDVTLGIWASSEDEGAAAATPAAIWQDLAGTLREEREASARDPGAARAAWQPPEERRSASVLRGAARVVDTGRLKLDGQTIRLFGVEGQGGKAAREFRQYLKRRDVACEPAGEAEVYRCKAGSQDLSEVVLFNGAGRAAPGATPDLAAAEANAKARKAGIWQD